MTEDLATLHLLTAEQARKTTRGIGEKYMTTLHQLYHLSGY